MSMSRAARRVHSPSAAPAESLSAPPVCRVTETTDEAVVPLNDRACIEDTPEGQRFVLRAVDHPPWIQVPVEAVDGRREAGPWNSIKPAIISGVEYSLQVSLFLNRLYGLLVPESRVGAVGASRDEDEAEEPIVVWGSEDEGEGTPKEEAPGRR